MTKKKEASKNGETADVAKVPITDQTNGHSESVNIKVKVQGVIDGLREVSNQGRCCGHKIATQWMLRLKEIADFMDRFYNTLDVWTTKYLTTSLVTGVKFYELYPYTLVVNFRLVFHLFVPISSGVFEHVWEQYSATGDAVDLDEFAKTFRELRTVHQESEHIHGVALDCSKTQCEPYVIALPRKVLQIGVYLALDTNDFRETAKLISPVPIPIFDDPAKVTDIIGGVTNGVVKDYYTQTHKPVNAYFVGHNVFVRQIPYLRITWFNPKKTEIYGLKLKIAKLKT